MSNDLVPPTPTISEASFNEDWDRSLILEDPSASNSKPSLASPEGTTTHQNSVVFPAGQEEDHKPPKQRLMRSNEKRTLSELLKLHAEEGTNVTFSQEEALRVGDELGQWINASSSPYEADDDFFARARDDTAIPTKASSNPPEVRVRGQSESLRRPS